MSPWSTGGARPARSGQGAWSASRATLPGARLQSLEPVAVAASKQLAGELDVRLRGPARRLREMARHGEPGGFAIGLGLGELGVAVLRPGRVQPVDRLPVARARGPAGRRAAGAAPRAGPRRRPGCPADPRPAPTGRASAARARSRSRHPAGSCPGRTRAAPASCPSRAGAGRRRGRRRDRGQGRSLDGRLTAGDAADPATDSRIRDRSRSISAPMVPAPGPWPSAS